MMTPTEYNPELLAQWSIDASHSPELNQSLAAYIQQFGHLFNSSQMKYFSVFLKGLFSSLERKSLEPIALYFLGEKSVRSMQQFFSRAPLDLPAFMNTYHQLLSSQIAHPGGMLSVDDSSFVKKGIRSVGVARQYCGRLGKRENCQVGVFLAYATELGYGLVDRELYIPQEWYEKSYTKLREECQLPEDKLFATKNQIALKMLNQALKSSLFPVRWIGCDAAYGCDHSFIDGLELPEGVFYFAATNAKEQIFRERPEIYPPERSGGKGRPSKHAAYSIEKTTVRQVAEDPEIAWETVVLMEGSKGPVQAKRKIIRCTASRKDGNRNYLKPGEDIWLYIRLYENGDTKYFISNAPAETSAGELDRAATLRWPIEQCFEECKSNLGMSHYECRSYPGWMRHMSFVMAAHLFTLQVRIAVKKKEFP